MTQAEIDTLCPRPGCRDGFARPSPVACRPLTDLREQLQQSLGDAYTIERELGGGGMARVFLADESALGRRVVIKLLPSELMGGVSIGRFRREISLKSNPRFDRVMQRIGAKTCPPRYKWPIGRPQK